MNTIRNSITIPIPKMPKKRWMCTKGHMWEADGMEIGIQFSGAMFGLSDTDRVQFCGRCFFEACQKTMGEVKEVFDYALDLDRRNT